MAQARIAKGEQVIEIDGLTAAAARELALCAARDLAGVVSVNTDEVKPRRPFGFRVDQEQATA